MSASIPPLRSRDYSRSTKGSADLLREILTHLADLRRGQEEIRSLLEARHSDISSAEGSRKGPASGGPPRDGRPPQRVQPLSRSAASNIDSL